VLLVGDRRLVPLFRNGEILFSMRTEVEEQEQTMLTSDKGHGKGGFGDGSWVLGIRKGDSPWLLSSCSAPTTASGGITMHNGFWSIDIYGTWTAVMGNVMVLSFVGFLPHLGTINIITFSVDFITQIQMISKMKLEESSVCP